MAITVGEFGKYTTKNNCYMNFTDCVQQQCTLPSAAMEFTPGLLASERLSSSRAVIAVVTGMLDLIHL